MKSLEELKKLRDEAKKNMDMRLTKNGYRVAIGMATCGIASGAREIMNKFLEEVSNHNLSNVKVTQVGCIGECTFEPIVEVIDDKGISTIYCLVTEKKVEEIVQEHLINGRRIERYLLSNVKK